MSTLSVGTIQSNTTTPPTIQNSTGTEIGTFCRAWVNFNGTGTVAIRAAFNVSSITDGGVGIYYLNLTNPLPTANYAVVASGADSGNVLGSVNNFAASRAISESQAGVYMVDSTNVLVDVVNINAILIGE